MAATAAPGHRLVFQYDSSVTGPVGYATEMGEGGDDWVTDSSSTNEAQLAHEDRRSRPRPVAAMPPDHNEQSMTNSEFEQNNV